MDSPKVYCAYDEMMDIVSLIPNPRNPNQHPEKQIELLAKIIKNQGWRAPITISNRSGFIVRGHGRLMAAKKLGLSQVPVDRQDYANEAEEWADLIADNRISELSQNDDTLLKDLLEELDTGAFDMDLTGFDEKELERLMSQFHVEEIEEDDFDVNNAVEKINEPTTKHGQIFRLGNHKLMCGDSTDLTFVQKLMNGVFADMIFTDPPYNVDYTGGTKDELKIKNDKMSNENFFLFLLDSYKAMFESVKPGSPIYVCHADFEGINFRKAMVDAGWEYKQSIIWVKNSFVMGRQDHHWQHEPILYGWKPGARHKWYGGRKQSTIIKSEDGIFVNKDQDKYQITFNNGLRKIIINVPDLEIVGVMDDKETTTWYIDKPLRNGEHPTMKPIKLCARAIKNSSKEGDIVLDLFGGSGSTLIACEQLKRINYIMELDPVYCDVIIQRFEQFTGQKAELVG